MKTRGEGKRGRKDKTRTARIELKAVGKKEWIFPPSPEEVVRQLDDLLDEAEVREVRPSEMAARLGTMVEEAPNFIDGFHHLALVLERGGQEDLAHPLWEKAVLIGLQALVGKMAADGHRLGWGWMDNRPFLRAYHSLGLSYLRGGDPEMALSIFRTMLALNPGDDQGIRCLAINSCLELKKFQEALELCGKYPGDMMAETLFGEALAHFALKEISQAERAARRAVSLLPKVAEELAKSRHPKPRDLQEDSMSLGGADQAWFYWREAGKAWNEVPGALDFLKRFLAEWKILPKRSRPGQGNPNLH